jgi:hypothetical protein
MPGRDSTELPGAHGDERDLDQLIPPPWSARRRVVLLLAVLAVGALLIVTLRSGLLGPRLAEGDVSGGSVQAGDPQQMVAERHVLIRNVAWMPVAIEAAELPPLEGVSWGSVQGLPVTLEPGESHEVVVSFVVAGCEVDVQGYGVLPLRARSGIAQARIVQVPVAAWNDPLQREHYFIGAEDHPLSTVDEDAWMTLPPWPDQPPSWLLDAIHAPCSTPPNE